MDAINPSGVKVVDVNSLTIEELTSLQRQLDSELSFFKESVAELRAIANKFGRCQATLSSIDEKEKNRQALIPLSESVYIKAKVPDCNKYLIEIGTGYFAEMSRENATNYFKRKYSLLEEQLGTINCKVIPEKTQAKQLVVSTLQKKIQEKIVI